ncbi:MAG: hypothetical protein ACRDT2_02335 [Natronosporangium sp.]
MADQLRPVTARRASEIARRFTDRDLDVLGVATQGRVLIARGDARDGLGRLTRRWSPSLATNCRRSSPAGGVRYSAGGMSLTAARARVDLVRVGDLGGYAPGRRPNATGCRRSAAVVTFRDQRRGIDRTAIRFCRRQDSAARRGNARTLWASARGRPCRTIIAAVEGSHVAGEGLAEAAFGFPPELQRDVAAVLDILPPPQHRLPSSFSVVVGGERVGIPYRIYHPEPSEWILRALTSTQLRIVRCLYTRHHDGYVRQRHLGYLLPTPVPWVVPYVVQLVGEYVVEIVQVIRSGLAEVDVPGSPYHEAYGRFAAANPEFLALTNQRVVSYWNCYYRGSYLQLDEYPGQIIVKSLRAASSHYGVRF